MLMYVAVEHCQTEEMMADFFPSHYKVHYSLNYITSSWGLSMPIQTVKLTGVCWIKMMGVGIWKLTEKQKTSRQNMMPTIVNVWE